MKQKTFKKTFKTVRGTGVYYRQKMRNQMVSKNLRYQSGEVFNRKNGYVWNVFRSGNSVVLTVKKVTVYNKQQSC